MERIVRSLAFLVACGVMTALVVLLSDAAVSRSRTAVDAGSSHTAMPSGTPSESTNPASTPQLTPSPTSTPTPTLPESTGPLPQASATPIPTPPPPPADAFVSRDGTRLVLESQPYEFAGINIYNANSDGWCGHEMRSPGRLAAALDALAPGTNAIRAWFFQPLALSADGSGRDWSAFDSTLAEAGARGLKVIVTLSDQWGECGSKVGTQIKSPDWYRTGYLEVDSGNLTSYRDFVSEIVARYRDDPTILFWQLMNEAETKDPASGSCEPDGHLVLRDFAADVSGLIKSLDPNHLVSLGTMGGPQCGPHRDFYGIVHDVPTIDVCEFHDYSPTEAMPTFMYDDGYDNGLESRIQICHDLAKPIFVGESGIPRDIGLEERAKRIRAKIQTQFRAGVAGYLAWDFADVTLDATYDLHPGDPALVELRVQRGAGIVTASGTELSADGERWYLYGASTYHTTNRGGPNDPDEIIAMAEAGGLNTLRIGEMFHQLADGPPDAPYDESDWARTDLFLDKLRESGMRAILDLSAYRNFLVHRDLAAGGWTELCRDDIGVTVEQRLTVDFAGTSPYRSAVLPEWDAFIDFVANRVNTVNGLAYRDDPTIAIISFAGEPAPPDSIICGKAANTAELTSFYDHVFAEWKSHDASHLLSNGGLIHIDWAELHGDADGSGIDWEAIFALPDNDVPSLHTYPARIDGRVPADYQSPKVSAFVAGLGKPWFTEEFGWPQGVGSGDATRADYLQWVHDQQVAYDSAGAAFWNLGVELANGTFDINPSTPLAWAVVRANAPHPVEPPETVTARLTAGGIADSDAEGVGTHLQDPVMTTVTASIDGLVVIEERAVEQPDSEQWIVFDHEVMVHIPAAAPDAPTTIRFELDASISDFSLPAEFLQVFRAGAPVPLCTATATPDPCVSDRVRAAGGDLVAEIRTTAGGDWTFGFDPTPGPIVLITTPSDGATYARGQAVAAEFECAVESGQMAQCEAPIGSGELLDTWTVGTHEFTVTLVDGDVVVERTHSYEVLDGDPRLTGAVFRAADIFSFPNGQVQVDATCDPDGTSTVTYNASGQVGRDDRPGPFRGTFSETGTAVFGPQTILAGEGVAYGPLESFEATFVIDSPAGLVTGTKSLAIPGFRGGICNTPAAGSPFSGANLRLLEGSVTYDARISVGDYVSRDTGTAANFLFFACASRCDDAYESRFVTDGSPTAIDADGDGVDDAIGTGGGGFDDGAGTTGTLVDAADNDVLILGHPFGVLIRVSGGTEDVVITACGGFTLRLAPGSEALIHCGSITTQVLEGQVQLVLGDGLSTVSIPAGVTALVDEAPDGGFTIDHQDGDENITIVVDGVEASVSPGTSVELQAWDFVGFASPVNASPVINLVTAGQSVPLKWRILDADGQPVTNLSTATIRVTTLSCDAGATTDRLEEVVTGSSGLQNLGDGYYQLNWKTPRSYAGSCKSLSLDIGDGVLHVALFQLTR